MSKKNKNAKKSKKNQDVETKVTDLDFEGVEFANADEKDLESEQIAWDKLVANANDDANDSTNDDVTYGVNEDDTDGIDGIIDGINGDIQVDLSLDADIDVDSLVEGEVDAEFILGAEQSLEEAFELLTSDADENDLEMNSEEGVEADEDQPLSLIAEDGSAVEIVQITDDEAVSVIESLLFITDRPVGLSTFKNAFAGTNVTTKKIKALIAELQADLAQVRRGVILEEVDGAYQMRTKVDNQDYIKKIIKAKTFKLTGPSLETLAVIAYKQPCIKADVDEVRGVESGHLVRALMDKGLVAFAGKSDLPGKPMFYKTTRKFLEIFGLRNTSELPTLKEMEELLPEGIGDEEEKETLSDLTGKLSENYDGNYSVAEDELGKITEQLAGISTNTEFFEDEKRKQKEKQERERAENLQEAIALGEDVDSKDVKWLERYEAKMAAELEEQEASEKQALQADSDETENETIEDLLNVEVQEGGDNEAGLAMAAEQQSPPEVNFDVFDGFDNDSEEQETLNSEKSEDPLDLL